MIINVDLMNNAILENVHQGVLLMSIVQMDSDVMEEIACPSASLDRIAYKISIAISIIKSAIPNAYTIQIAPKVINVTKANVLNPVDKTTDAMRISIAIGKIFCVMSRAKMMQIAPVMKNVFRDNA